MQPQDPNAAPLRERRAHLRMPCSRTCRIAPYKRGARATSLEFELAQLNDISAGGFSFWATRCPPYAELVFRLTDESAAAVFLAHVRHVQHVMDRFIVGCQIVRLLNDPASMSGVARILGARAVSPSVFRRAGSHPSDRPD